MADKTVTVKSSGGDYTTLNAALSGESTDLVTNTRILTIDCYNLEDTTAADTGTGYTTSASYYIKIQAHDSHGGKWSTSAYRLVANSLSVLTLKENYVKLIGIQIGSTYGDASILIHIDGTFTDNGNLITVDRCIFKGNNNLSYISSGTGLIRVSSDYVDIIVSNSLFYNHSNGANEYCFGIVLLNFNGTSQILNCSFTGTRNGIKRSYSTATVTNCVFSGCTSDAVGTITDTYCATTNDNSKGLTALGTGNRFSQTFTFVGADDFHLASNDVGAIGYGTDLSGSGVTTDIDGQDRPTGAGTWDIGADEYVAAGGETFSETITDGFKHGETLARNARFAKAITDGFKSGESTGKIANLKAISSDGSKLSETIARILTGRKSATDGAKIGEALARRVASGKSASDGVKIAETLARILRGTKTSSDGIKLSDSASKIAAIRVAITDGAKVSEAVYRLGSLRATASDGMKLSESLAVAAAMLAAAVDGAKFSETIEVDLSGILEGIISDGFRVSDSQSATAHFFKTLADGAKIGEQIARVLTAVKSASDGGKFSEALARTLSGGKTAADGVVLSEVSLGEILIGIIQALASDGFAASDGAAVRTDFHVEVSDGFEFSEVVSTVLRFVAAVVDGFQVGDAAIAVDVNLVSGVMTITITAKRATISFTAKRPEIIFN